MKSIREKTGVSATGRYVRPTDFISLYPTHFKTSFSLKNPREIFLLKTFVESNYIMNKEIAEFAKIAGFDVQERLGFEDELKQFAELIVQHCIYKFGQTRTEPSLHKFIMEGLKNE
jgi:hypothetical protein